MRAMTDTAASATSSKHPSNGHGNGHDNESDGPQQPSKLYKLVMTPINFASFIISLVLVDMQYSLRRVHSHAEAPTRLPSWLHSLLFCPQPYQPAHYRKDANAAAGGSRDSWSEQYYHSNQRRLMEMEAEEAFRMRNMVLIVFGLAVAGAAGAAWFFATRLYRCWFV
ncbi:hypothetical protein JDV02_001822 [Purpureocillium takamizusanense]|uniref:Uncharacterized protein n=1 Tax=Purpureocillium takamizusanense TaxID=2060973 RepID=A0A9Q8Q812_9HYPO|nr:uncharacterized protein JDV02_001822 [Purpureocillium takamizusanense]UNI15278.1 hypothetical protein JDV02_001822 [Purpureocillium takamizusanense]